MKNKIKIGLIPGSLRNKSYNRCVINYIKQILDKENVETIIIDLKKFNLPVFDEDIESAGVPENVIEFQNLLNECNGFVISTPEYNHSLPGGLKNAIDWASRFKTPLFKDKYIALTGASMGPGGTIRSQIAMLSVMRNLGGIIISTQSYISLAQNVFDENGNLLDDDIAKSLEILSKHLISYY